MVRSCTGQLVEHQCTLFRGRLSSGCPLVTAKFLSPLLLRCHTDAIVGARSRAWRLFERQVMAYKEANPQMFVRIIALPTARVMNTNNSRCYPWEDKKQ
ncbi:Protein phoH [Citrobacter sedlakii]